MLRSSVLRDKGAFYWLRESSLDIVVVAVLLLGCGAASLALGQDGSWDLQSYHFYIGYAFVEGRLDYDLAPAGLGTYLNPVLDAVHYLSIVHLSPRLFGFLLGAFQGLNPALVFLLARRLLDRSLNALLLALLAGILAATGPSARSLLGTTMGDTSVSVPALLALLLALEDQRTPGRRAGATRLLLVGLLGGVAMGLKLTMVPYLVALGFLVVALYLRKGTSLAGAVSFLSGSVLGFLAIGGYWCWVLWQRFGNPVFPFANDIFRSPYLKHEAVRDLRWATHTPWDYLTVPVDIALGVTTHLQEVSFRDARLLLLLLAGLAWLGLRLAGRRHALPPVQRDLLLYLSVAYVIWLVVFYYYRYAAVLEFLAPLALVILVNAALPRLARPMFVATTAFVLLFSYTGSWGRYDWRREWFRVRLPTQAREPDNLVLLHGPRATFVIPYFPKETQFVFLGRLGSDRFQALLAARIASHRGSLMVLAPQDRLEMEAERLELFGLSLTEDCGLVRTSIDKRLLCRVQRSSRSQGS